MKYIIFGVLFFTTKLFSQSIVIPTGSSWKFYDQGNVNDITWNATNFDDSAWSSGNAELGYGDGDETTVLSYGTDANNKYTTTYFRKNIQLNGTSGLQCSVKIDDGAIVYLNGTEVFRNNLPSGTTSYSTFALNSNNENTWYNFLISASLVSVGTNTIAVEMHQASGSSSDISFDFELTELALPPNPGLYINEVMASNDTTAVDQANEAEDWIEIYNSYSNAVDLNGYYISDKLNNITKFQFTSSLIIPANGYLIIWASEELGRGNNHVDFKLSSGGEDIVLTDPDGLTIIDSFSFPELEEDMSYGRETDGSSVLGYISPSSYNSFNLSSDNYAELLETPIFSHEGGFYPSNFNLSLSSIDQGATIYYTLDGSEPDPNNLSGSTFNYKNDYPNGNLLNENFISYQYSNPILVSDKSNQPNKVSLKNTLSYYYQSPSNLVKKNTIVSAIVVKPNALKSKTITKSFFIGNNLESTLPIASIVTPEENLFGYNSGIYTAGQIYDTAYLNGNSGGCGENSGNFGQRGSNWERQGSFEFFENNSLISSQNIGIRIHGGCSRTFKRKSLRIYSDDSFESGILGNSEHKRLILRNSGNDWNLLGFQDAFYHDLVKSFNIGKQNANPSVLYINGEYWGIHNVRERIDEHYLEYLYDVDKDEVDLLNVAFVNQLEVENGDLINYNSLISFLKTSDFSLVSNQDLYKAKIDSKNLIDYEIAEIFSANGDWPYNNLKLWRSKEIGSSEFKDGKWRWILFDTDYGLGSQNPATHNSFYNSLTSNDNRLPFKKLLEIPELKNEFILRFSDMLNTVLSTSYSTDKLNDWKNKFDPEIQEHINRWRSPNTKNEWLNNISSTNTFLTDRPNNQWAHIKSQFNLGSKRNITLSVSDLTQGYIKINSIDIIETTDGVSVNPYPWSGQYFEDIPLTLEAKSNTGYKFSYWEKNNVYFSSNESVSVTLNADDSYNAVYEIEILSQNPYPLAVNLGKCGYKFEYWGENSTAGTFPPNMSFVYFDEEDPELTDQTIEDLTSGAYNLTSRTRINGLNGNGISFLNTGNEDGNPGFPGVKLGGAILALNTIGKEEVFIDWKAATLELNSKEYALALQYRIGDIQPFQDVLDDQNNPIVYNRDSNLGVYNNISAKLPPEALNNEYVQVLWKYYYTGNGSGSRDKLALDDIKVYSKKDITISINSNSIYNSDSIIESNSIINNSNNVHFDAGNYIFLEPGFETKTNVVFEAEIEVCN